MRNLAVMLVVFAIAAPLWVAVQIPLLFYLLIDTTICRIPKPETRKWQYYYCPNPELN